MVDVLDSRSVRWAEFVPETTLGTTPSNPTMQAFPGDLVNFKIGGQAELEEYPYLKGPTDTDPLSSGKAIKTGESHSVSVTLKASALTLLPYVLCAATPSTYNPGTTILPVSIGAKIGSEYCLISGAVLQSWTLDFKDQKSTAELTLEFLGVDRTDWDTDYIGSGSHAAAPSSAPYTMSSLSSVLYDAADPGDADITLESLKLGISNQINPVIDLTKAYPSKIGNWAYGLRDISLEMGSSCSGVSVQDDVFGGAAHTVAFTLGGKTFTVSNVVWTNAPDVEGGPENLIGMSLSCAPKAARLAIA
ncbi:hypothetical protein MSSAC_2765 [Methanosarcina siciliae C2J]|uniref:Uncharacterized protein n=1 Tax=Methanosarcina siciliae C2J TaxID=1434118 RepID=A0A0E3PQ31_9EURY|nr:hypothetical protein [Methanosarcina siciliae]AKB37355.1 hypothetical protein MSSAC_2765 [Methanosarcina siciliae C2J]